MLQSYRDLVVWQKSVDLAELGYRLTEQFPQREMYGLSSQIRRAGASVASNIAEGYGRGSRREYVQFLAIAQGSLKELETPIILAERLTFATTSKAKRMLDDCEVIGKMLGALIRSLRAKERN